MVGSAPAVKLPLKLALGLVPMLKRELRPMPGLPLRLAAWQAVQAMARLPLSSQAPSWKRPEPVSQVSHPALQAAKRRPQQLLQALPAQPQAASIPVAPDSVAAPAVAAHCAAQRVFPASPVPAQIMRR